MYCLHTWPQELFGQDLQVHYTTLDLFFLMTLTFKVKYLDFCLLSYIYRFDQYLDKPKLISKPTCWVMLTWPWPLYDIDLFHFCFNCHNFFHLLMDFIHTWTEQNGWPNQHLWWFWYDLDRNWILLCKQTKKVERSCFVYFREDDRKGLPSNNICDIINDVNMFTDV